MSYFNNWSEHKIQDKNIALFSLLRRTSNHVRAVMWIFLTSSSMKINARSSISILVVLDAMVSRSSSLSIIAVLLIEVPSIKTTIFRSQLAD